MKRIFLLFLLINIACGAAFSGDTLSLKQCWEWGGTHYPLAKQSALFDASLDEQLTAIALKSYFPRLTLSGQATYQSDVTWIGSVLPAGVNIEKPTQDQYRAVLDVQQTLYDANRSKSAKAVERLNAQEAKQQNAADMHTLKQQIQQVYFTGLLQQSYAETLKLTLATLNERIRTTRSALNNGMASLRDLNLLEVERLKIEKQLSETQSDKEACVKMLAELTGMPFSADAVFSLPEFSADLNGTMENRRVEMAAFDTRTARLIASKDLLTTEILPQVNLFGNLGYGRPGYNILSNEFEPFYMLGLRVSWVPWDGNLIKRQKKNLDIQAQVMANQKAAFDENIRTAAWAKLYDIRKQENLLKQDEQIVKLRIQIAKESASQLDNGSLTTSDYIADLNAETLARLSAENIKIQLVKAQLDYQLILGIEER